MTYFSFFLSLYTDDHVSVKELFLQNNDGRGNCCVLVIHIQEAIPRMGLTIWCDNFFYHHTYYHTEKYHLYSDANNLDSMDEVMWNCFTALFAINLT